jgi:histone deacetylase 1/2
MLLQELKPKDLHTPVLCCDNQTALGMLNDELVSLRTKHLEVRFHFIKEKLQESSIKLSYVPSTEMVANMFTMP